MNFTITTAQIVLDENFSDWDSVQVLYDDMQDDIPNEVSFGKLKVSSDDSFIYFYIELGKELNLQDNNSITIFIDSDNNLSTGKQILGMGAEFEFTFGERRGYYYFQNGYTQISQNDIGLLSSPTVSSDKFEFLFDRKTKINGQDLFLNDTVKIMFRDGSAGDIIPNEQGGIQYVFENFVYEDNNYSLQKDALTHFRVMSFNVHKDDLFDSANKEHFRRLISVINPDIIGFQEIYQHSSQETADLINEFIPSEWYHSKLSNDNICVSRFPILSEYAIDGNAAFLIDISSTLLNDEMLFISAHPPCCGNDDQRQAEIDHIMSFIRDAKNGSGVLQLKDNSPIVIVGDMNLVGLSRQQFTFYSGDILNESVYGSDFSPDWDGSFFEDAMPLTTGLPASFTWYSESSSFSPGRLDYIIFSGSVMELRNSFALFTPALPADTLSEYNLELNDSKLASDHIPVAADFQLKVIEGADEVPLNFELFQNYPNPFNPTTTIKYSIPASVSKFNLPVKVTLKIYDLLGQEVLTLINEVQAAGNYEVEFDASNLTSGVFFYQLRAGNFVETKKMVLMK